MFSFGRDKLYYFYAAALIVLLLVLIPFYYHNYGSIEEDPISSKAKTELYGEYMKIKPLAEIVLIKEEPFFKRAEKGGRLYYEFTSSHNGRQVFNHYNKQFTDNGWTMVRIDESEYDKDTGHTGRSTAYYQKGKIFSHVHYNVKPPVPDKPIKFSIFLYMPSN